MPKSNILYLCLQLRTLRVAGNSHGISVCLQELSKFDALFCQFWILQQAETKKGTFSQIRVIFSKSELTAFELYSPWLSST